VSQEVQDFGFGSRTDVITFQIMTSSASKLLLFLSKILTVGKLRKIMNIKSSIMSPHVATW